MAKSLATEQDFLNYTFKATAFPWNAIGNVYISLHTADPGSGGDQTTNEATYGNYGRITVARTGAQWTLSSNQMSNINAIQFAQCNGGTNTITYVAIGTQTSGAGQILYSGVLNSPLGVSNLVQPQFAAGALTVQEL